MGGGLQIRIGEIARFSQNIEKTTNNMNMLKIIFILSIICAAFNCVIGIVDGNISAACGWFVSALTELLLLHCYLKLEK